MRVAAFAAMLALSCVSAVGDLPEETAVSSADWLEAARSAEPLRLHWGDGPLLLALRPNVVTPGSAALDGMTLLEGEVLGMAGSVVRASVAGQDVQGLILMDDAALRITPAGLVGFAASARPGPAVQPPAVVESGLDFGMEMVEWTAATAAEPESAPARTEALAHAWVASLGPDSCVRPAPLALADPTKLVDGWALTRTFDVAFAVDAEYAAALGAGWPQAALTVANNVDGIYQRELDMRVRVVSLHAHAADVMPSLETDALLAEAKVHYDHAHATLSRENVHVLSGKRFTNAVGQAACIGGAGDAAIAYTVGEALADPLHVPGSDRVGADQTWFDDSPTLIAAHEMGHILSAHHHFATCGASALTVDMKHLNEVCSLMFPDISVASPAMSPLERLSARGWADEHDL